MLTYQPKPNTIIMCNFEGFISPEMVKNRPVIVLTKSKDNPKLVTIVPISTTEPHEITDLHVEIVGPIDGKKAWVKCDMVTTVCLERLDRLKVMGAGGRYTWGTKSLDVDTFQQVKKSVANYLGLIHNN